MDWFRSRIARYPRPALVAGKTLFIAGSILILAAVFARGGMVYPPYARWLVPEGPLGYAVAAALVVIGMALTVLAEKAIKGPAR